jgi:hypothetical protein
MAVTAQRFVLASRLVGEPTTDSFRLDQVQVPIAMTETGDNVTTPAVARVSPQ